MTVERGSGRRKSGRRESDPAWQAYRAWLVAAKAAAGDGSDTWPELAREISRGEVRRLNSRVANPPVDRLQHAQREAEDLASVTSKWAARSTGTAVRNWHNRCELPREPVLMRALGRVVTRLVPDPPSSVGEWGDFGELVANLNVQRIGGRATVSNGGAKGSRQPGALAGLLRWGPGRARDIDAVALGLGSWAFAGDLPPYVSRGADDLLRALVRPRTAIDDRGGPPGLAVVVGPPKAGKTRSLLEVLKSTFPAAMVWWVNAAPDVLPTLVLQVERAIKGDGGNRDEDAGAHGLVVVIDDAHLCGVKPSGGLTHTALTRLTRLAGVVLTVHERDLVEWQRQVIDRTTPGYERPISGIEDSPNGIGATPQLVDLLNANRVDYSSVLTIEEMPGVTASLAASPLAQCDEHDSLVLPDHVERWAEFLAAVDQLAAKAATGKSAGGYRHAVIEAALDASYLCLPTVTPGEMEALVQFHYSKIGPTRFWDPQKYELALEWALTPIGASGSPHAILQADHTTNGYRLLDGLQRRLEPAEGYHANHLLPIADALPPGAYMIAGRIAASHGDEETSHKWFGLVLADMSTSSDNPMLDGFGSPGRQRFAPALRALPASKGDGDPNILAWAEMLETELMERVDAWLEATLQVDLGEGVAASREEVETWARAHRVEIQQVILRDSIDLLASFASSQPGAEHKPLVEPMLYLDFGQFISGFRALLLGSVRNAMDDLLEAQVRLDISQSGHEPASWLLSALAATTGRPEDEWHAGLRGNSGSKHSVQLARRAGASVAILLLRESGYEVVPELHFDGGIWDVAEAVDHCVASSESSYSLLQRLGVPFWAMRFLTSQSRGDPEAFTIIRAAAKEIAEVLGSPAKGSQ